MIFDWFTFLRGLVDFILLYNTQSLIMKKVIRMLRFEIAEIEEQCKNNARLKFHHSLEFFTFSSCYNVFSDEILCSRYIFIVSGGAK